MNPLLVTMSGPEKIDLQKLSDFEAGIATLVLIDKMYPGIKFKDLESLANSDSMSGWWTDAKKAVGSAASGVGNIVSSAVGMVGNTSGSAVRLLTDTKVIDGASRIGTAYATGGGSEGVKGFFNSLGMTGATSQGAAGGIDDFISFISGLGSSAKDKDAGNKPNYVPYLIGGGALLLVVLVAKK
jgi:hypothetical protein